jgi:hypothetical protein
MVSAPHVGYAQSAKSKTKSRATAPVTITWSSNVVAQRGQTGWTGLFACPAGGTAGSVWGDGIYTDDSSVCTAAVHAGVFTLATGGTVRVAVQSGEPAYKGATRHGVASRTYGKWAGSFVVVGGKAGKAPKQSKAKVAVKKATWTDNATALRGKNGTRGIYICPPGGTVGTVWGTGTYTDDSSICSAAVHAGKIKRAVGGRVTIEITPGLGKYIGSAANGVTSNTYGRWTGSYVFR